MANTSRMALVDRVLGGRLEQLLRSWAGEDLPLAEMAYRLRNDHGVVLSAETIRRWCNDLGIEKGTTSDKGAA